MVQLQATTCEGTPAESMSWADVKLAGLTVILLRTPCSCSRRATDTLPVAACTSSRCTRVVCVATAEVCRPQPCLSGLGRRQCCQMMHCWHCKQQLRLVPSWLNKAEHEKSVKADLEVRRHGLCMLVRNAADPSSKSTKTGSAAYFTCCKGAVVGTEQRLSASSPT